VGGKLFFKENKNVSESPEYVSTPPIVLNSDDNTFYNSQNYIPAVN